MEDVYFERIAGVGERKGENGPRRPEGATPVRPKEKPVLTMALDDDAPPGAALGASTVPGAMTPPPTGAHVECDENGFPVSPLRDQEDLWFVQAASLYRPLAKSVGVARASGLLLILSGLATMVVAAPTKSILGLGLGFAVLVLGILERKAGNDLSQVKRGAPFRLALHQVVLFGLIAGSCWMSMQAVHEQAALALEQASADQHLSDLELQQVEMAGSLIPKMISAWFNVVIAAFAVIHGGLALYYLTRSRRIRMFHNELPPWVTDIVKTLMAR